MLSCLKISIPSNSISAINSSKRLRRFPNSLLSKCSGIFPNCNWIKFRNIHVHRKNDRPSFWFYQLTKTTDLSLTVGITTYPIHHIKSTDHSSPYGLLQIQFTIKNLRTTPVHTDFCRSNSPQIIYRLLQTLRICACSICN